MRTIIFIVGMGLLEFLYTVNGLTFPIQADLSLGFFTTILMIADAIELKSKFK